MEDDADTLDASDLLEGDLERGDLNCDLGGGDKGPRVVFFFLKEKAASSSKTSLSRPVEVRLGDSMRVCSKGPRVFQVDVLSARWG